MEMRSCLAGAFGTHRSVRGLLAFDSHGWAGTLRVWRGVRLVHYRGGLCYSLLRRTAFRCVVRARSSLTRAWEVEAFPAMFLSFSLIPCVEEVARFNAERKHRLNGTLESNLGVRAELIAQGDGDLWGNVFANMPECENFTKHIERRKCMLSLPAAQGFRYEDAEDPVLKAGIGARDVGIEAFGCLRFLENQFIEL
ncbi:hypothetical protein Efla_004034 [Eimeria flavescens]